MTPAAADDEAWMRRALALARAQLGSTAPNPAVGCVVVKGGRLIAEGATGAGGRPHAEEIALEAAGPDARGAVAYVSLEPCRERSSGTASCSLRLVQAGVGRVVAACEDPHGHGAGGAARLAASGVVVEVGLLRAEAEALNAGFFKLTRTGRPLVVVHDDGATFDAELTLAPGETAEAALDRLGAAGLTRVWARRGSAAAAALEAANLLDNEESQPESKTGLP